MKPASMRLLIASYFSLLTSISFAATVQLDDGGDNFGPSDLFTVSVSATNLDATSQFDAYLALQLPNTNLLFLKLDQGNPSFVAGTTDPATWTPLAANFTLPMNSSTAQIPVLNYSVTGNEPLGDYKWFLAITNAGSTNLLNLQTGDFRFHSTPFNQFKGSYNGSWTNTTFNSTGPALLSISDNTPGKLDVTLDLDGFVGGFIDPDPVTMLSTIESDGTISFSGDIDMLGPLTFTIAPDGTFDISANSIPVSGFSSFTATGTIDGSSVNLNYTVNFDPSGSASGTVTGTK